MKIRAAMSHVEGTLLLLLLLKNCTTFMIVMVFLCSVRCTDIQMFFFILTHTMVNLESHQTLGGKGKFQLTPRKHPK